MKRFGTRKVDSKTNLWVYCSIHDGQTNRTEKPFLFMNTSYASVVVVWTCLEDCRAFASRMASVMKRTIQEGRSAGRFNSVSDNAMESNSAQSSPLESVVIQLDGTLGAGKTQFTKFLATALGVPSENVTSPTFVLMHEYPSVPRMVHIDAYRLRDEDEFYEMGAEEIMESGGVILVEWGEKVEELLLEDRIRMSIGLSEEDHRTVRVEAMGPLCSRIVEALV